MSDTQKLILKNVRFDWVQVFAPVAFDAESDPKYSICVILPKTHPQVKELQEASLRIAKTQHSKVPVGSLKLPLRDGDEDREGVHYKGMYFFNASATTKFPPTVIDGAKNKVDVSVWNSGDYGNISIELYAFEKRGNKGTAAGINAVQFVRKGEPLGQRDHAEDFTVESIDIETGE